MGNGQARCEALPPPPMLDGVALAKLYPAEPGRVTTILGGAFTQVCGLVYHPPPPPAPAEALVVGAATAAAAAPSSSAPYEPVPAALLDGVPNTRGVLFVSLSNGSIRVLNLATGKLSRERFGLLPGAKRKAVVQQGGGGLYSGDPAVAPTLGTLRYMAKAPLPLSAAVRHAAAAAAASGAVTRPWRHHTTTAGGIMANTDVTPAPWRWASYGGGAAAANAAQAAAVAATATTTTTATTTGAVIHAGGMGVLPPPAAWRTGPAAKQPPPFDIHTPVWLYAGDGVHDTFGLCPEWVLTFRPADPCDRPLDFPESSKQHSHHPAPAGRAEVSAPAGGAVDTFFLCPPRNDDDDDGGAVQGRATLAGPIAAAAAAAPTIAAAGGDSRRVRLAGGDAAADAAAQQYRRSLHDIMGLGGDPPGPRDDASFAAVLRAPACVAPFSCGRYVLYIDARYGRFRCHDVGVHDTVRTFTFRHGPCMPCAERDDTRTLIRMADDHRDDPSAAAAARRYAMTTLTPAGRRRGMTPTQDQRQQTTGGPLTVPYDIVRCPPDRDPYALSAFPDAVFYVSLGGSRPGAVPLARFHVGVSRDRVWSEWLAPSGLVGGHVYPPGSASSSSEFGPKTLCAPPLFGLMVALWVLVADYCTVEQELCPVPLQLLFRDSGGEESASPTPSAVVHPLFVPTADPTTTAAAAAWHLAVLPSGHVLVSHAHSRSLYAVDTRSGAIVRVAGDGGTTTRGDLRQDAAAVRDDDACFACPGQMAVVDTRAGGVERCVYVADGGSSGGVRRVTLPDHYWQPLQA